MELIDKARILVEFIQRYFADDEYDDFFDYNDLGVPMAVMIVNDLVTLTDEGKNLLNETYLEMCAAIGCDNNADYTDLDDMFDSLL